MRSHVKSYGVVPYLVTQDNIKYCYVNQLQVKINGVV